MSQLSRQTMNRIRTAKYVSSALSAHGALLAKRLPRYKDGLAEEELAKFLSGLVRTLEESNADLTQKEQEYASEQGEDPTARAAREEALSACQQTLGNINRRLASIGGAELAASFGLPSAMPQQPDRVAQMAANVVSLLDAHKDDLVDEFKETTSPQKLAKALAEKTEALQDALNLVNKEQRETQVALFERDKATEQWANVYQGISRVAEGLFILVGETELADRVRYSARRRAGKDASEDDTETSTDADGTTSNPSPSIPQGS